MRLYLVVLSRPPAVWSSTNLCVPAGDAAHQQHVLLRFRGPCARASAVSSTSAQNARSPSTARPPAEWCSVDLISIPPNQPKSFPAALAARRTSGACDGALLSFIHWLFLAGQVLISGSLEAFSTNSLWSSDSGNIFYRSSEGTLFVHCGRKTCYMLNFTELNQLTEALVKHCWDNQPESVNC